MSRHKAKPSEPPRRKVCQKAQKVCYSRKAALGAANHQAAAGTCQVPLYVYKCPHCRSYHLTRQNRGQNNTQDATKLQHGLTTKENVVL